MQTPFEAIARTYIPAIEDELKQAVSRADTPESREMHRMLAYHLGWANEGAAAEAGGKRIRPLLVMLVCESAGGDWSKALPAAVAVELIHNFSLIHDDIQDNSPLRRGRPTLWKVWGIAQAINAGDAMFTLAQMALLDLQENLPLKATLQASRILQEACLHLTQGQYMDLSYEARGDLDLDAYWPMVTGKTAALLQACCELGALAAEAPPDVRKSYRDFGRSLGLAFQAQDDLLGIWGDSDRTGKSIASDLVSGKKSLPVLYGLSLKGKFAERWSRGPILPEEAPEVARQLELEGARDYTQSHAGSLTERALQALEDARPQGQAGDALRSLAFALLKREA